MPDFLSAFVKSIANNTRGAWEETEESLVLQGRPAFDKNETSDVISSKGLPYTAAALWNCHRLRHENYGAYVTHCIKFAVNKVDMSDRKRVLRLIKTRAQAARDAESVGDMAVKARKRFFVNSKYLKLCEEKEFNCYYLNDPKKLKSISADEAFDLMDAFEKLCSEQKSQGKKSAATGELRSSETKLKPIILVPDAVTAAINIYNAPVFFEQKRYVSNDEIAGGKTGGVVRVRSLISNADVDFEIVDAVESSKDWERVVAVVVSGKEWQFKSYKYQPPLLFSKVKGFYFQWEDRAVDEKVTRWNVEVLRLSRENRAKDAVAVFEFWRRLYDSLKRRRNKNLCLLPKETKAPMDDLLFGQIKALFA